MKAGVKRRIEKRIQPDGSAILVRMGRIKESKYARHQGEREKARRIKQMGVRS